MPMSKGLRLVVIGIDRALRSSVATAQLIGHIARVSAANAYFGCAFFGS
jgi:hypothetical protein